MPGSTGPAIVLWTSAAGDQGSARSPVAWSPAGDWILTWGRKGAFLLSPEGETERQLTSRLPEVMGFSRDGRQVLGMFRNTTGQGAEWQLYAIDVPTGAQTLLAPVDFPITTENMEGFSLHPDGTRFATSIARWPFDIWMLEGFDGP
jgi:hypothetical protein